MSIKGWVDVDRSGVRRRVTRAARWDRSLHARRERSRHPRLFADYQPPVFEENFEQMMNKLAAFPDRLGTQAHLYANKKDQVLYRLERVEKSVQRAKTPILWPVQDAIDRTREAVYNDAPGSRGRRPVKRHPVTSSTTLGAVAIRLGANIDDLIKLNPNLLSNPEIQPGNVVRYYRS